MLQGFANPVFDSQCTFRRVMEAMANPGSARRVATLSDEGADVPPAALATLLAMCDFETPVYLSPEIRRSTSVADAIRFHTGAEVTDDPSKAWFAVVDPVADGLDLTHFAQGTAEYPDRSTTVIVLCRSLSTGPEMTLQGPGVPTDRVITPAGLPANFLAQMNVNHAGFPLGVDLLLVADEQIVGLPRSARLS